MAVGQVEIHLINSQAINLAKDMPDCQVTLMRPASVRFSRTNRSASYHRSGSTSAPTASKPAPATTLVKRVAMAKNAEQKVTQAA